MENILNKKLLISIDGPAASGKGTIADLLGKELKLPILHTGNIYRAIAYKIWSFKQDPHQLSNAIKAAQILSLNELDNPSLNDEIIGEYASIISVYPEVRNITYQLQRNYIDSSEGAVIEGRDIGTVICPEAKFKFYLNANVETRAKRRAMQLQDINYEIILTDLKIRDERDQNRATAPLKPASDAVIIDTSEMTISETLNKLLAIINN